MDVKHVNPVIGAFTSILPQIGFQVVDKAGVEVKENTVDNPGVIITVSVVGSLKGCIMIGMTVDAAKKFASTMMMGMEVAELDALAQSAISEMANMVCANTCTQFGEIGIAGLDISPPSLIVGVGGKVMLPVPKVLVVHINADDIKLEVHIGLLADRSK